MSAQLLLPLPIPVAEPRSSSSPGLAAEIPAHWDDVAIALTDGTSKKLRAVSAAAGRAGVRAGMRVTEARALCADLREFLWDDTAITAAITEMSAALIGGSPQVTPVDGAPGLWWVGASGFDGVGGEMALAKALLRIARIWHPRSRVAIAESCVAARAATWAGASFSSAGSEASLVHIVPPGQDALYLAPAPLALVPMEEELRTTLHALGLRTVGALAALAADDVERRWGSAGLTAWRLSRAEDARRPVLARAQTHPAVEVELSTPVTTMEPILFLVRSALDRLVNDMITHGRAVAAMAITLTLDDARGPLGNAPPHTVTREARTARPLARVVPLFERLRALLAGWTLDAPVIAVRVAIVAAAPLSGEQGDLLSSGWRDLAAADAALERLRAELGTGAIVRAEAQDTHRPERSGVWQELGDTVPAQTGVQQSNQRADVRAQATVVSHQPAADQPVAVRAQAVGTLPWQHGKTSRSAGTVTLHLHRDSVPLTRTARRTLDPPEAVDMICDGDIPRAFTWRGERITVTRAIGPERLSGDWWDNGYRRDYWRCESLFGEVMMFWDRMDEGWRVQAWAD